MSGAATSATDETFDYVIVGSGAAGSILAARLSEGGSASVCLIEAGPRDNHRFIHIPAGFTKILPIPKYVWHFGTTPTERTGGRSVSLPQGRTLGGSTSVNGMIFVRGVPSDFNGWAQMGNRGWGYADVLPYFKRLERREGPGDNQYRGRDGKVAVTDVNYREPLSRSFIEGASGLGLPFNSDYNGKEQFGVGYYQTTIHGGRRISTARAYLKPARSNANLTIKTGTLVKRIIIDGKTATGVMVETVDGKESHTIKARRELLICAGSINTTRLLQISGIGDPETVSAIGVTPIHDLPGVGQNLQDHYYTTATARVKGAATFNEMSRGLRLVREVLRWGLGRPSLLGLPPSLVQIFAKSRAGLDDPDMQGIFFPASYGASGLADAPGMTCGMWQHRPHSRGFVKTVSTDFAVNPEIQPNYLSEDLDRQTVVAGLKLARNLLATPQIRRYVDAELTPGPDVRSEDELLDYCYRTGSTTFHPVGTAKMGPKSDPTAVVDHELRIHGLQSIRVVDASVMPTLVSGNTAATTMMIAEKASDMIMGK